MRLARRKTNTILAIGTMCLTSVAWGAGTPAGTDISNTAEVTYQAGTDTISESTNAVVITVAEIIDVDVLVQSPQVPVAPGDVNQAVVFTVTNSGNGNETFTLSALSIIPGDDFDPALSTPESLFFDTDGSGDLSSADQPYVAGSNDPVLAPDGAVTVLLVNDIPSTGAPDASIGQTRLSAEATTGTGAPGTVFTGAGDNGVDALIGATEGSDADVGEYIVETIDLSVTKSATVADPFGGNLPVPGAEITYQIVTTVVGTGVATAAVVNDQIPANTTYLPDSITLNGALLTDASDADAGEFNGPGGPSVVVQIGDVTDVGGPQIVEFKVVID